MNVVRDPLYVSLSTDGFRFDDTRVVASCELPAFHPVDDSGPKGRGSRWGCEYRYPGGAKQGGCQYPQAVAVQPGGGGGAAAEAFWAIFSVNKEDIWVARVPYTF